MANLCTKLRLREKNKYRKIITIDSAIYSDNVIQISSSTPYVPGAALEDGEWFCVQQASHQEYTIDLMTANYDTVDFRALTRTEFDKVDYIFIEIGNVICFQNIPKSKLLSKKRVFSLGEHFEYQDNQKEIVINDIPDAIYNKHSDVLYFRRLESITGIFVGIDLLFKEATNEEVTQFLSNDFIQLKDGYNTSKVNTANRKRIALAQQTLNELDADSRNNIFEYIGEYCPKLRSADASFEVSTEEELKMLLYGIEQRFYTTVVGNEKRIANSVVPLYH